MNKHSICLGLFVAWLGYGCAKEKPKPVHTEPWLAHPPASARPDSDAAVKALRFVLTDKSVVRFEMHDRRGHAAHGSFSKVKGELALNLGALGDSTAQVQVDLDSLTLSADGMDESALLQRAQKSLDLSDAGATSSGVHGASYDITSFEDVSPAFLEPAPASDAGAPFMRRIRGTAVGNLLLHGLRVQRRAPLEAEFSFTQNRDEPVSVVIRSRAPLVVSLETHEIRGREPSSGGDQASRDRAPASAREARVSVELYGIRSGQTAAARPSQSPSHD